MIYFSVLLGIIFGWVLNKFNKKNQTLVYMLSVLPYSIFFFLSFENREVWGAYRLAAFFATFTAGITWAILKWTNKDKSV